MTSPTQTPTDPIACPFVYANGKTCTGHIVRVEAYKADIDWLLGASGEWSFGFGPRSHHHLFCSEKGNHAGHRRHDDPQMKFHWRELPERLQALLGSTGPRSP